MDLNYNLDIETVFEEKNFKMTYPLHNTEALPCWFDNT